MHLKLLNKRVNISSDVVLINGKDEAYIRNSSGYFVITGKSSYPLCAWLFHKLGQCTTVNEALQSAPEHLKNHLTLLLKSLFKHRFIRYDSSKRLNTTPEPQNIESDHLRFISQNSPQEKNTLHSFSRGKFVCTGEAGFLPSLIFSLWLYGARNFLTANPTCPLNTMDGGKGNIILRVELRDKNIRVILLETDIYLVLIQEGDISLLRGSHCRLSQIKREPLQNKAAFAIATHYMAFALFNLSGTSKLRAVFKNKAVKISKDDCTIHFHAYAKWPDTLTFKKPFPTDPEIKHFIRRSDICFATNTKKLLSELERINALILPLVDTLFGPILKLEEDSLEQIPLSQIRCHVIARDFSPSEKSFSIHCFGLSARECRNQVVLCAFETFLSSFPIRIEGTTQANFLLKRENQDPFAIGVGWSYYEALYRAVKNYAAKIKIKTDPSVWIPLALEDFSLSQKREATYLYGIYTLFSTEYETISYLKLEGYLNLYMASSVSSLTGKFISPEDWEIGLTPYHAALNLLNHKMAHKLHPVDKQENVKVFSTMLWDQAAYDDWHLFSTDIKEKLSVFHLERNSESCREKLRGLHVIAVAAKRGK